MTTPRTIGDTMETPTDQSTQPLSPWQRFGWLMGAIWLVFLVFPIIAVLAAPVHPVWQVVAVAAIVAFGALYAYGFIRLMRPGAANPAWLASAMLLVLVLLFVLVWVIAGVDAFGMTIFLLTFGIFHQPFRRGFLLAGGWILFTFGVLLITDSFASHGFFLALLAIIGAITGVVRWLDERQDDHQRLETELNLVAERERVARDVHDVLGHSLTVITVKSELAERLVDADPAAAKAELAQIRSMTREALAEIRATVAGLRVARLTDELVSARAALADAGIAAEVPTDVDVVDPRHRLLLAWVLREAVTNVVRHSDARHCTVQLAMTSLVVLDDGVGPGAAVTAGAVAPAQAANSGVERAGAGTGLRGVAERVHSAGATLEITTAEGGGTRLEVRW
ncbi:MAG TPA: sensor histidine kinase [Candidatus Ruania gallistercoris]|uniref:Sensor histidine kinase n=1 Tax=Candidatus Ruania gallistercoris TaxID=2838746 RepID=A0A9D2EBF3_9MICO|nr:sensor histidine kinase [Candidatus Ruania gallistercoris]